jgi:hypothetical protein
MSISFATIPEIMVMQFPQDPTFILTFSLGVIALVLSTHNFYVNRTRTSRSEQIRISRDLWEHINEKYDPIREKGTKGWPKDESGNIDVPWPLFTSLFREIDYFAYLVLENEIKDEVVISYYKHYLSDYIETILTDYASPNIRHDLYENYYYFERLVRKWGIKRPEEET